MFGRGRGVVSSFKGRNFGGFGIGTPLESADCLCVAKEDSWTWVEGWLFVALTVKWGRKCGGRLAYFCSDGAVESSSSTADIDGAERSSDFSF